MTTFDFQDDNGPVPAHRHTNPDGSEGGWVADTATVASTARVSENARVSGNAEVSGDARVSGNALVYGYARVSGNARIKKPNDYLTIGPIGSRDATLTWTRSNNRLETGCFSGTVEEFAAAVEKEHGDNAHNKAYQAALAFIAALRSAEGKR